MANANVGTSGLNRRLEGLLTCSICISMFIDPFVTPCGHSFCYSCIHQHLAAGERCEDLRTQAGREEDEEGDEEEERRVQRVQRVQREGKSGEQASSLCPQCSSPLRRDQLNPSFVLKAVVKYVSQERQHASQEHGPYQSLKNYLGSNKEYLSSKELEQLRAQIQEYKEDAERKEKAGTMNLLLHFLHQSKDEKAKRLEALKREIECLDADITACRDPGALAENIAGVSGDDGSRAVGMASDVYPTLETADGQNIEVDESHMEDADQERRSQRQEGQMARPVQLGPRGVQAQATSNDEHVDHGQVSSEMTGHVLEAGEQFGQDGTGTNKSNSKSALELLCSNKRRRIASQFEDLQNVYLQLRSSGNRYVEGEDSRGNPHHTSDSGDVPNMTPSRHRTIAAGSMATASDAAVTTTSGLQKFSKILGTLAHSNRLRILAKIPRPPLRNQSSIISSVEYDRTGKFFATAGVSKRISVFDQANTLANASQGLPIANCPIVEMVTRSKLSCISWNKFISSELASSDYEGVLNVWDTSTGNLVHEYEAHSKRIWSVDHCCADPKLLVTGSDDSFVKVWSTKSPSAIAQCDVRANVCAVKWHPTQPHTVAIGAADHKVYIFDMRKYDTAMASFSGHKKAVSYVRWAGNDIVSASTDCTLRLWSTQRAALSGGECMQEERTYRGHLNERNFVGLAVSDDLIICGSETHEVFTYYQPLSKPITKIALPVAGGVGVTARTHSRDRPFVSAVAWHPTKKELLSATSQGSVFMLSLEGELDREDE